MKRNASGLGILFMMVLVLTFWGCGSKSEVAPGDMMEGGDADRSAMDDDAGRMGGVPGEGEGDASTSERTGSTANAYQFGNIYFEFDRYRLTPEANGVLTRHAKALMENPSWTALVEGHCDERGTVEYNLALGEKRADAAKQFLTNYGVAPSRVRIISYGKERPAVMGSTEAAWAKNRRCEFKITR